MTRLHLDIEAFKADLRAGYEPVIQQAHANATDQRQRDYVEIQVRLIPLIVEIAGEQMNCDQLGLPSKLYADAVGRTLGNVLFNLRRSLQPLDFIRLMEAMMNTVNNGPEQANAIVGEPVGFVPMKSGGHT